MNKEATWLAEQLRTSKGSQVSKQMLTFYLKKPRYPICEQLEDIGKILNIPIEDIKRTAFLDFMNRKTSGELPNAFKEGFTKTSKILSISNKEEQELITLIRKNKEITKDLLAIAKTLIKSRNS